ncbi:hypothetical protein AHYW_002168 [Providencia manganoxydans]
MRGVNQNVTLSRVEWCVLATMTPILCVGLSVFALYAVKQPLFGMSFENKAASAEPARGCDCFVFLGLVTITVATANKEINQ